MRVIFRATFQGPKGALNPMKLNMPKVEMTVDVFRMGENWRAKVPAGNMLKLPAEPTHGCMTDAVEACFDSQVSKWQMCRSEDAVPLDADYVEEDPKGNFSMREVTHVSSKAQTAHTVNGPNYYMTACGVEAHVKLIRSYRSRHAPLCKVCKLEWDKTPEEERFKP